MDDVEPWPPKFQNHSVEPVAPHPSDSERRVRTGRPPRTITINHYWSGLFYFTSCHYLIQLIQFHQDRDGRLVPASPRLEICRRALDGFLQAFGEDLPVAEKNHSTLALICTLHWFEIDCIKSVHKSPSVWLCWSLFNSLKLDQLHKGFTATAAPCRSSCPYHHFGQSQCARHPRGKKKQSCQGILSSERSGTAPFKP